MKNPLDCNPDLRFECLGCERGCCSLFEIRLTAAERDALGKLDLPGAAEPERNFLPVNDGSGDFILAKDAVSGRCVFSDGCRCAIHAKYGYAAKPLSCRVFPLHIQEWSDGRISAEYRFICPAIGRDRGKKLQERESEIRSLARELAARRGTDEVVYSDANTAPLTAVREVHAALSRILHDRSLDWALRFYAVARIVDFHRGKDLFEAIRHADTQFATDAVAFVGKARPILEDELRRGKVDALTRTNFRNLLCGYLRDDAAVKSRGPLFRLQRAWQQFRLVAGPGHLEALNPSAPAVAGCFFPLRDRRFSLHPEAEKLFAAFFFGKLDSMHFCGKMVHLYTYEEGIRHLLMLPPLAFALAAGFAAASGRTQVDGESMLKAVRLLDHTFARSPFFRLGMARSWLSQQLKPPAYAGLLRETLGCF